MPHNPHPQILGQQASHAPAAASWLSSQSRGSVQLLLLDSQVGFTLAPVTEVTHGALWRVRRQAIFPAWGKRAGGPIAWPPPPESSWIPPCSPSLGSFSPPGSEEVQGHGTVSVETVHTEIWHLDLGLPTHCVLVLS